LRIRFLLLSQVDRLYKKVHFHIYIVEIVAACFILHPGNINKYSSYLEIKR